MSDWPTTSNASPDISRRLDRLHEDIQGVRGEVRGLREEMNANHASLREEMNAGDASLREEINALRSEMHANNASIRRESRWIGGVIIAGIIITVLSIVITRL